MNRHHHPTGTFAWVDLATPDAAAAMQFYGGLFGWSFRSQDAAQRPYVYCTLDHEDVAGLWQADEAARELVAQRAWWTPSVNVEDVATTVDRVRALGGTVVDGPHTVGEMGISARIQDPAGAFLALWQPGTHPGAARRDTPGAFTWAELAVPDPGQVRGFYKDLLGWTDSVTQERGGAYTTFRLGEHRVAGMMELREEWQGTRPEWHPYFQVDDCDVVATRARQLGGQILHPPTDVPGTGRFAIVRDPQGAVLGVIRLDLA